MGSRRRSWPEVVVHPHAGAGHLTGQFLLLGSASLDLVHMSSESLAGRISYIDLGGVNVDEAGGVGLNEDVVWVRGGFPDSLTADSDIESARWRADLIRSYLERDVPMFAPRIPVETLRRLWTMVAHSSGALLNASRLAAGLGVSAPAVDRYLDLLTDLGLLRRLQPWHTNTGKRLTKSPKVFVRDSGLLHALLELTSLDDVLAHPSAGPSYESFAVECLIQAAGESLRPYHYRTARGDEVDLVLVRGGRPVAAIGVTRSTAPVVSAGFHRAMADIGAEHRFIVHPDTGELPYATTGDVTVIGLTTLVNRLRHDLR